MDKDWFDTLTPAQAREWVRQHATASNPYAISMTQSRSHTVSTVQLADAAPSAGPDSAYENTKRDINTINLQIQDHLNSGKTEESPEVKELRRAETIHRRRLNNLVTRTY